MPSLKTLSKIGEVVGNTLGDIGRGIRAYHGSPHDFERFDISKIGTGEGAQTYGHGLYFAENPETALSYRTRLSRPTTAAGTIPPDVVAASTHLDKGGFDTNAQFLNALRDDMRRGRDWREHWDVNQTPADRAAADVINRYLTEVRPPAGRTYEVNIRAKPEEFLNIETPGMATVGEQPPFIRERLLGLGFKPSQTSWAAVPKYAEQRSQLLDTGIPGIRYPDQGSRGAAPSSSTSNYVLFRDDIIDILRKYGLAGAAPGIGAARTLSDMAADDGR